MKNGLTFKNKTLDAKVPRVSLSVTSSLSEETKTNLIAHNDNDNTNSGAKIQQKYDTAKSDVNKLSGFKTSIEQR